MDMAGESPLKSGPEGRIPEFSIKFLASALDPYIRIEQGNGKAISRNIPPSKVNKTVALFFQKKPIEAFGFPFERNRLRFEIKRSETS